MTEHHVDRVHAESVVLDIGGDIGALILYTDPILRGAEIEISPRAAPDEKTHVEILERTVDGSTIFAGTYYGLTQGRYLLWGKSGPLDEAAVEGGKITRLDWRGRIQEL